ncbi:MAG: 3-dehydroquinate synthase II [Candidatus Poseidoniales archaeon]|nr:MAG: 3-dehydroquinate synthase II [Candidatus Poseidoniales archaeon]
MTMDVWSLGWNGTAAAAKGIARCLLLSDETVDGTPPATLDLRHGADETSGAVHVHVGGEEDQQAALAHVGLAEWIVLSFQDWSMIPVENVVAAAQGTPTKVAALVESPQQVAGAAFALEHGVDAIAVRPTDALLDAAMAMRAARLEQHQASPDGHQPHDHQGLNISKVTAVEPFGVGDRVCVDLTGLLHPGEGMLVGSTAAHMVLVHGETVPSAFVPTRPFRVNAGAVHQYTLLPNGSTRYLSELKPGDEVLVTDPTGTSRTLVVGRLKVERRPFLSVVFNDEKGQEGRVILQNAETVRLVDARGSPMSVTAIETGTRLITWYDSTGRHVGQPIESEVTEH